MNEFLNKIKEDIDFCYKYNCPISLAQYSKILKQLNMWADGILLYYRKED